MNVQHPAWLRRGGKYEVLVSIESTSAFRFDLWLICDLDLFGFWIWISSSRQNSTSHPTLVLLHPMPFFARS